MPRRSLGCGLAALALLAALVVPSAATASPAIGDPAPELAGVRGWLNGPPRTLRSLRGRVVLVKFWTFACSNCRHTFAETQAWYDRYHARGLEIVSVHTPELDMERVPANVERAVRDARITYPVALDPDAATWNAWGNAYWPAWYLVDARGRVRFQHIGEGGDAETRHAIETLLDENGAARR